LVRLFFDFRCHIAYPVCANTRRRTEVEVSADERILEPVNIRQLGFTEECLATKNFYDAKYDNANANSNLSADCHTVLSSCVREHTCFGIYEYAPSAAPSASPAPTALETLSPTLSPVAPTASPVATPGGPITILSSDFSANADGFTYSDDVFRGTSNPSYASGTYEASEGAGGDGALEVSLGGINDDDISGMSGGWQKTFTLSSTQAGIATIEITYQLVLGANYESNEYSEALCSVGGILVGDGSSDALAKLIGDGNGGVNQNTGWTTATLNAGRLGQGNHTLVIGAYNNIKTLSDEQTWFRIDSVHVSVKTQAPLFLLQADFSTNAEGFTYADDLFRNTNNAGYSDGVYQGSKGFTGDGALEVTLGGIDNHDIWGMSGGWQKTFTLSSTQAGQAYITIVYQLEQAANYESNEYTEALCSVDGSLVGAGGTDYLSRLTGDGNGGYNQKVGYTTVTLDAGQLLAGSHTIAIGVHNNIKTWNDEESWIRIDSIEIRTV